MVVILPRKKTVTHTKDRISFDPRKEGRYSFLKVLDMLDEGKESSADIYLVPDLSLEPRFLVFLCKYEKRRKHSLTTRDFIKTTFSPPPLNRLWEMDPPKTVPEEDPISVSYFRIIYISTRKKISLLHMLCCLYIQINATNRPHQKELNFTESE